DGRRFGGRRVPPPRGLLERYDVAEVYPAYSHLSSLSHTTMATASAYVEHMDDGTLQGVSVVL
ncbi:hypothetical protein ACWCSD_52705, partial [Nonomuraea sp. NPDC001684]